MFRAVLPRGLYVVEQRVKYRVNTVSTARLPLPWTCSRGPRQGLLHTWRVRKRPRQAGRGVLPPACPPAGEWHPSPEGLLEPAPASSLLKDCVVIQLHSVLGCKAELLRLCCTTGLRWVGLALLAHGGPQGSAAGPGHVQGSALGSRPSLALQALPEFLRQGS